MKKKNLPISLLLIFLFVVQLWAAIIISDSISATSGAHSVTSASFTSSGDTAFVVAVSYWEAGGAVVITDNRDGCGSPCNTWSSGTAQCQSGSECIRINWVCGPTTGTTHSVTVSGTSIFPSIAVYRLTGTAISSCNDGESAGASVVGTTLQPGSLTPSQNNGIVITACGTTNAQGTGTVDGGFTKDEELQADVDSDGIMSFSLIQTTAVATNPNIGWDNSTGVSCVSQAFKIAAAAGNTVRAMTLRGVGP